MEDDGKDITQPLSLLDKAKSTELQTEGRNPSVAEANGERDGQRIPSKEERLKMQRNERLALLEGLGYLPYDADWSDYKIAEDTSWWGRRLDPEVFWKDKVIWLDGTAVGEARRRGLAIRQCRTKTLRAGSRARICRVTDPVVSKHIGFVGS